MLYVVVKGTCVIMNNTTKIIALSFLNTTITGMGIGMITRALMLAVPALRAPIYVVGMSISAYQGYAKAERAIKEINSLRKVELNTPIYGVNN